MLHTIEKISFCSSVVVGYIYQNELPTNSTKTHVCLMSKHHDISYQNIYMIYTGKSNKYELRYAL